MTALESSDLGDDPLWFKDALIYELHVRAFQDSNADGIGDFGGLTQRLDYLQDLGVTALWLLPFYPSPLRDDGYDIADYSAIHPDYGTMAQFRRFLAEAHRRGLRVITELVINHTSDQHAWFQRAARARPGSRFRDWYVWSDSPEKYNEARIIFQDFETSNWSWHAGAQAYYWHRFYSHQPDLNFENPEVQRGVKRLLDYWLDMGVDGVRLDAIPYLFEREGTNCENLPETHDFLKELRRHLDDNHRNRMFLAEANQWPEDASAYFGDGDECHMNFHFPLMPRLFMAVRMEDRFPLIDILQQTPSITESSQWALFLRNHDELTLEMVTDEERDYMYRAYAHDPRMRINLGIRRRLGPLLGNNRRVIELLTGLLFSMPGTPVLYYGDEIGMGDNIYLGDRNGVRTPMQWSADRNAGFSRANPQKLYLPVIIDPEYHYETVNVEAQLNNSNSLLWWTKRLIALRRRAGKVFGRGSIEFLYPENAKVLAFVRAYEDQRVLVVANLSRYAQSCTLDLSAYRGQILVELFGQTSFPPVTDQPYQLTLGPHAFYWFGLEADRRDLLESPTSRGSAPAASAPQELVSLTVSGPWQSVVQGRARGRLEQVLPDHLRARRWFGGKGRKIRSASIVETVDVGPMNAPPVAVLLVVNVEYTEGEPEQYAVPIAAASAEHAERLGDSATPLVAWIETGDGLMVLYDGMADPRFATLLLDSIERKRRFKGARGGRLLARRTSAFQELVGPDIAALEPRLMGADQSNTSVAYGDRLVLKLLRKLESGTNPDLEVTRFLTERARVPHVPPVGGSIEYRPEGREAATLAVLQRFVPNEGDAWAYTLDELGRFAEQILSAPPEDRNAAAPKLADMATAELPATVYDIIGPFIGSAELLGTRSAELHVALSSDTSDPAFAPEPLTSLYQRSVYQSMRSLTRKAFHALRRGVRRLPEPQQELAIAVLAREGEVLERFQSLTAGRIDAVRTRIHGDYHLGQVLWTGKDFVIVDFEGEPARPIGERRLKRSPLRDVAGMVRSFHYAASAAALQQVERGLVTEGSEAQASLRSWLGYWHQWVEAAYLRGYLRAAAGAAFIPDDVLQLRRLLDAYVIEKAVYELGYEMNNRPAWIEIPLRGIVAVLDATT